MVFPLHIPRPHSSHRSLEDFRARILPALASCGDDVSCPGFLFRDHITYIQRLYAAFGDSVHVIPTERLYDETAAVLDDVARLLNVRSHDFHTVANLSVNVNGNPGTEATQEKSIGDYPPLTPEILAETRSAVLAVTEFVQYTTGFDIRGSWDM